MAVYPDESYMQQVVGRSLHHFAANRPGPVSFLASYQPYHYILDGRAAQELQQFFAQEPPPYLKVSTHN